MKFADRLKARQQEANKAIANTADLIAAVEATSLEVGLSTTVVEKPRDERKPLSFRERIAAKKAAEEAVQAKLEAVVPPTTSQTPIAKAVATTLSTSPEAMMATFMEQRFTREEALEEVEALVELFTKDPAIRDIWAASSIPLNSKQTLAVYYAKTGQSFVLTGAAGTGKTTAQAAVVETLDKSGLFQTNEFKYLGVAPSIAIVAFTKVAVRNIQKAIRKNPRIAQYVKHCMTIHALLEYEPVVVTRRNPETGALYDVRIFEPQRDRDNPLTLTHLIIEEASMVGVDLWKRLYDALTPGVQIIYLGDINQLTPVFSKPVLGYALVKLPVIELTRVYRQALDNPIIYNAHRVLRGETIESSTDGRVAVVQGPKTKTGQQMMALMLQQTFKKMAAIGHYDPEQDIILTPWNKRDLGVKRINELIATMLSGHDTPVYCVQGGMNKWYLAIGDRVLVDKRQGKIISINPNPKYLGGASQSPAFQTRDGTPILVDMDGIDFDFDPSADMNDGVANVPEIDYSEVDLTNVETDEGKRAATHIVQVRWLDNPDGPVGELSTSGDFGENYFQLGYALTVHKSQGSEWRKVFIIVHFEHMGFLSRELMYTALTRAAEEVVIFGDLFTIEAACKKQEIQGTGLEAKIAYFISEGLPDLDIVPVTKSAANWYDWSSPYGDEEEIYVDEAYAIDA